MRIYKSGNVGKPEILLLPDMAVDKTYFDGITPYLEKAYTVLCAEYTGIHDNEVFISLTDEAEKIEKYIQENSDGHIHAIYGSAFGGSLATLLVQRGNISFDSVILGSPKLDKSMPIIAKTKAKMKSQKVDEGIKETVYNQVLSDLTTPFEKKILPKQGKVHIVYSVKMGEIYKQRYEKTFADSNIMMFDYASEELLKEYPKHLSLIIRKCTGDLKIKE